MFLDGCFKGRDCLSTSLGPSFGSDTLTSNHMKEMHMDEISSLAHLILRFLRAGLSSSPWNRVTSICIFRFREGNGKPLQYSCLENPMDGGAWWAAVHGVAMSQTQLNDFIFTFHFHSLEKEMATHSSVLAWRIPGMAEHGGLPSMGSYRVGHD